MSSTVFGFGFVVGISDGFIVCGSEVFGIILSGFDGSLFRLDLSSVFDDRPVVRGTNSMSFFAKNWDDSLSSAGMWSLSQERTSKVSSSIRL